MTETSHLITPSSRNARSAVSNGSRLVHGVDGRSASARRFRDLVQQYTQELGGEAIMTEPMRAMVKQAAAVTVEAERLQAAIVREEQVNADDLVRVSNVLQRLLNGLKTKAKTAKASQRTQAVTDYLRKKAAA